MLEVRRQQLAKLLVEHPELSVAEAMRSLGYSESYARSGSQLTQSDSFKQELQKYFPDQLVAQRHVELLNSTRIDHMVFPLAMSDEEITELLQSVNCTPKKFMHGETANHVWFWSPDNKARKDGLDMVYKLKGSYAPEKKQNLNVNVELSELLKELQQDENTIIRPTPENGRANREN